MQVPATSAFDQPGTDGIVPFTLSEWRKGVVYTVRPESLQPLVRGREYSIVSRFARRKEDPFGGYAELYGRAAAFPARRAREAVCETPGDPLHHWIEAQTWQTFGLRQGPRNYVFAAVSTRLRFPNPGDLPPSGEAFPEDAELAEPGGETPEAAAARYAGTAPVHLGEIFNEFDFASAPGPGLFSYGEYVPSAEAVQFEPFIERAERRARSWNPEIRIIGREWFCATSPDLAVVHLYYESPSDQT